MNYYKGKYAIGIYKVIRREGDTDELVGLFESTKEFAEALKTGIENAYHILRNHFNGSQKQITIGNKLYELAFIDMLED